MPSEGSNSNPIDELVAATKVFIPGLGTLSMTEVQMILARRAQKVHKRNQPKCDTVQQTNTNTK